MFDSFEALKEGTPLSLQQDVVQCFRSTYARGTIRLSDGESTRVEFELACAAALSVVLIARLALREPDIPFREAECWFLGEHRDGINGFSDVGWPDRSLLDPLSRIDYNSDLEDLLPYVMEVFDTGPTGGSRTADISRRNDRERKRQFGTFYTPSDVAAFITERVVRNWLQVSSDHGPTLPRVLDPACGTGVFLVSAFESLDARFSISNSVADRVQLCTSALFGIDLSEQAIQGCAFALLARCLLGARERNIDGVWQHWRAIRRNLSCLDSVELLRNCSPSLGGDQLYLGNYDEVGRTCLRATFPSAGDGFDIIIGNPPYSIASQLSPSGNVGSRGAAYLPFLRMMWEFAQKRAAAAGMVVPLSLGYHSGQQFHRLRREMAHVPGRWEFAFFDRTPDSLFGDDVKTRNCIALLSLKEGAAPELCTSSFVRWNSRQRSTFLADIEFTTVGWRLAGRCLPKLGSELEVRCYSTLRNHGQPVLRNHVTAVALDRHVASSQIAFGATAYNWIPVFRETPEAFREILSARVTSSLAGLECGDDDCANLVFAICASRIAYWLWRVEGDGFHLPQGFILGLPAPIECLSQPDRVELIVLARQLWSEMLRSPVVSINKGVQSVSFSPEAAHKTLEKIDVVLARNLGLPAEFPRFLSEFVLRTIVAGRESEHRVNPALKRVNVGAP